MERTIKINGREVRLKPSANFMFFYKRARIEGEDAPDFQKDLQLIAGMEKQQKLLSKIDKKNAFDILGKANIFEFAAIIRRMIWTFAYSADRSIKPYEQWCDELVDYDIAESAKVVMEMIEDCFFLMLGFRKEQQTG